MTTDEIIEHIHKKKGSQMVFPFGYLPVCFKVCNRLFAELYPKEDGRKITLRCDPILAEAWRQQYPGGVIPGYHCPERQRRYKNTVLLDMGLADEMIRIMIDHSYDEAVKRLKKSDRDALDCLDQETGEEHATNL